MNNFSLLINTASVLAVASREFLGGVEYVAVPVVAARVGVMNGLFYTKEALESSARAWNGTPVPVGHPKKDGEFFSANHEDFLDGNIGWFDRVSFSSETNALKGTMLLNVEKMTKLNHADLLVKLEAGDVVDVSTGLYPVINEVAGDFNGEKYTGEVTSIMPDHLAILPNERGACSPVKGCGTHIHANSESACCNSCASKKKTVQAKPSLFSNAFRAIGTILGFAANESSFGEIHEKIRTTLRASRVDSNWWPYIMDVYDNFFVYESDNVLFKQGYAMDAAEVVSLIGEPIQVIVERKYVTVSPTTNKNKNETMKPHIIGILASLLATNAITADQKKVIEELPEKALESLFPAPATNAQVQTPAPVVNSGLTTEERELFNMLKANAASEITKNASRKAALVEVVAGHFTSMPKEVVANMELQALEGLASSIPGAQEKIVNFAGAAGSSTQPATNTNHEYVAPSILCRNGD